MRVWYRAHTACQQEYFLKKLLLCNLSLIDIGCNNARFYGKNCENLCPANCKDNTCHIEHGSCFKCKIGWTGMYCNTSKFTNIVLTI